MAGTKVRGVGDLVLEDGFGCCSNMGKRGGCLKQAGGMVMEEGLDWAAYEMF